MKSLFKIFHPEVFQGTTVKQNYFEGWYFKHVSASQDEAFAVIPGISLSDNRHAFIQYFDGKTGFSSYYRYNISEFEYEKKKFHIRIGNSSFSSDGIVLDLADETSRIKGEIVYFDLVKLPSSILSPGIMGWYSYVPTMECNHGVVSINHNLKGSFSINGKSKDFSGGKGYIEKDWGISFPESWMWMQCNNFPSKSLSVMISVAKIPWKGRYFIGFISFIHINGKTTILATYNGASISALRKTLTGQTEIIIEKGSLRLKALITKRKEGELKAPSSGMMKNIIKESLDSEVSIEIIKSGQRIISENGKHAGYEERDKIFSYFG